MNAINIMYLLDKKCSDISYSIEYNSTQDKFKFEYTIAGIHHAIKIDNISDIKTDKEAQELVTMIRENINYHLREQETKRQ